MNKISRGNKLTYGHQYIDDADIEAVVQALKSDFLTCGPRIAELEEKLCSLTGAKYAVVLSNGTAALHAACYAAGIGTGDEVITTPITFAASANCVLYCGGKPVFADIDQETWNISPKEIEKRVTNRTKAVIAVDFAGQAVQLDEIREICEKNRLILIEDAAHSIGTKYKGKPVGCIADMTTFSFHPVKTVTSGEGGAVLTNNKEYYEKLLLFRSHGITRDRNQMICNSDEGLWYYEQLFLGYNYRMTDIQAALLLSQLDKLSKFSVRRKEIVEMYNNAFCNNPRIRIQKVITDSDTVRHLYIIRVAQSEQTPTRKQVFEALMQRNIICGVHYIPVYWHPFYQNLGYERGCCPNAELFYSEALSLPLYYSLKNDEIHYVIQMIEEVLNSEANL